MSDLVVDTHAAIWYFANSTELSPTARNAINNAVVNHETLFLSAISLVEIVYLIERGRLLPATLPSLLHALNLPNSSFGVADLTSGVAQSLASISRAIVSDMPDRIIAATALHLGLPLITKDRQIQALPNVRTIW